MKLYTYKRIIYYFIFVFLISSCNTDGLNCPDNVNLGEYELIEESKLFLPYENFNEIIFENVTGNELNFEIIEAESWNGDGSISKTCSEISEPFAQVNYQYNSEFKSAKIVQDSLDIYFYILLSAIPYRIEPESGKVADIVRVSLKSPIDSEGGTILLQFKAAERSYPSDFYDAQIIESVELNNREFKNVYFNETEYNGKIYKTYFNKEFGLIGITDQEGNLWRFKEFI